MKVCPECDESYDEDVTTCPNDGAELVDAALPKNPSLREVLPVNPSEATSVIDLEAIEQARRERMIARGEDPDAPEPEPEPEPEHEHDPDATGTIDLERLEKKRKPKGEAEAPPTEEDVAEPEPASESAEEIPSDRTVVTRGARKSEGVKTEDKKESKSRPPLLVAAVLGGALVLAAGLAVGLVVAFGAWNGAVLTVTTVPPGATVLLDGKEVGRAPLQKRVKVGSHAIELVLDGYEPFQEVVEVPSEGLPFMQPLRALAKPEPEPEPEVVKEPSADVEALVKEIESLIEAGELDGAFEKVKELLKLFPDDARGDQLLDRVVEARMKAAGEPSSRRRPRRDDDGRPRKERARDACDEGERLLAAGSVPEAKVKLQTCLQLDPKSSRPHRSLARIYQREDNEDRTRYHLQRYLALGGKDPDYKVRRWLEDHPAR